MKIYNTLSRKIDEFKPINLPRVSIYICGPTVYDYAHLGHSRTYINSDILRRALKWLGYEMKTVMNITDVGHLTSNADSGEDKMEKKAKKESKDIREIAKFYTEDFWQMSESLNIIKPDKITPATEYIQEMIELIERLEKKDFTYKTKDGIYFDTSKFKTYGEMARLDIEGLRVGWRVDKGEKKNPTDFALWKFSPESEKRQMEWESPWGIGFPGWHIECSAMAMKELGESIDIHTGGIDHIPVHHTNEICQSEAATGKQFVKYWFHSGFLQVNGEKMSKSLQNYVRLQDLVAKGVEPMAVRYLFLTSHYRSTMNFTDQALAGASEAWKKLQSIVSGWQGKKQRTVLSEEKLVKIQEFSARFKAAVEVDLGMPQALAVVWEMVKSNIPEQDKNELWQDWNQVLGLKISNDKFQTSIQVQNLIKQREELRKQKKWAEADKIKQTLMAKGYIIEDTDEGTKIKHAKNSV